MLKKFLKVFIIFIIIGIMILSSNIAIVLAVTQSDLDKVKDEINEKQTEIQDVKKEISSTMKDVQKMTAEIGNYENEIADLSEKIEEVSAKIAEAEQKLQEEEEAYAEQKSLLEKRIVAMYEAGETTYLDVLLSSKSVTDFISRYYIISEIAENDKYLLSQIEKNKIDIEETRNLLATSKEQIENLKTNKEVTANALKKSQAVKESYVAELNDEEKALQDELEQLEAEQAQITKELNAQAQKYQAEIANLGGTGTLQKPVKNGVVTCNMYYSSGIYHGAIDYGIPVGTSVYAAADGVVLTAGWSTGGYGYHIWIQHGDGIRTCYGHGNGIFYVSVGDTVQKGQLIMQSGNTGNSTGPHLHFEVRVYPYNWKSGGGDSRRDPRNYF